MSARQLVASALGRGAQWRYFLLFLAAMAVPAALSFLPALHYLGWLFDHSPRSLDLVSRLDSPALTEVVRQLGESEAGGIAPGLFGGALVTLLVAPGLAGVTIAMARAGAEDTPLGVAALLRGAGAHYPRMLRMAVVGCLPLGLAGGGAALAFHLAHKYGERALTETASDRATEAATAASLLLVWLAHMTVEAGRARLAAEPERKSAFLAWLRGVLFVVREPRRVLAVGLSTTFLGVGGALLVTGIRTRVDVQGPGGIFLIALLGQLAIVAVAWGRSSRLIGLVELLRDESGEASGSRRRASWTGTAQGS